MKLRSLNEIFENRLIRIPDYQRGYAWRKQQLIDFWEDLTLLEADRVHYTGVITLEAVDRKTWSKWEDDEWLIDDLDYKPYFVVDGQQRLTTAIILIQAIIEKIPEGKSIANQFVSDLQAKFVQRKPTDGIRESYIFGYEKDNPSDEFLRTKIFGFQSHTNQLQETLYTRNLFNAKKFFKEKLEELSFEEMTVLYKKLTQKLRFNLYEIDDEIDVFVTFETMNNRGKSLTNLELLKNRLIYLSTLYRENEGRSKLRRNINDAWKTIYEYLGKNPEKPLPDDEFLKNHWIMYFTYSRDKGDDYKKFLLDKKFNARGITSPKKGEASLKIEEIQGYVASLQQSAMNWFYLHNPYFPIANSLSDDEQLWLDRLGRLGFSAFRPLILAAYNTNTSAIQIAELLRVAERFVFTVFSLSRRRANTGDTLIYGLARDLLTGKSSIDTIIKVIEGLITRYYDPNNYFTYIEDKYKFREGFYSWTDVRYFLYEHEYYLKEKGKNAVTKLMWNEFTESLDGYVTLEHIYPQIDTDPYWVSKFTHLDDQQRKWLTHSLGNLLPLSRAKNSSLQNDSFDLKKNNGKGLGYYNGSVSENEVNLKENWTPQKILERGLELLHFMEERWNIELGDEEFKRKLLHVDGIPFPVAVTEEEVTA
ncbi:hypothetical protein F895_03862 [Acinetobacter sp. CIP 64.2]|uniref:DUF262 domain-containing protein n=1 Tax=Acinetobacter sp. CIP 64.2 TaxID=1217694 RepID=UPI00028816BF|nr:DUF262 domain-containing protein [Acinetobacter sp. CIP 64.2]ENX11169.1 hypothetical protein F895_03862 [Acinetobacter sp. CIP 64.2]